MALSATWSSRYVKACSTSPFKCLPRKSSARSTPTGPRADSRYRHWSGARTVGRLRAPRCLGRSPPENTSMAHSAFLFPGQGAQSVGMGQQLCSSLPAARALFDEAAQILGYNLAEVCANGPVEKLNSTAVSQPAIFVVSLAALESLKASNPEAVEQCQAA